MCCGGVCVAMSCGGDSFSPDGAYDFSWDSVKADEGNIHHQFHPAPLTLSVSACSMFGSAASTYFAQTTTTIPGSS